ncbi:hypothetical protein [Rhodanobacter glycinis]|uniref:hypothetical protein n=1 Tax=Rhodanobacter glycinis TaxID=582702 RepID=UPI00112E643F|nr:hypothetical protein [Rhodanobacter glycinis]
MTEKDPSELDAKKVLEERLPPTLDIVSGAARIVDRFISSIDMASTPGSSWRTTSQRMGPAWPSRITRCPTPFGTGHPDIDVTSG